MRKGVIENIFYKFKKKSLNSYGLVFPEYIRDFILELREYEQDAHCLICLANDTKIWVDGNKMSMKDAPSYFITKAYDEKTGKLVDSTARKLDSGKKKVYRITMKGGKEVLATADHKWLTDKGWVKTIDLNKDTHILTCGNENE